MRDLLFIQDEYVEIGPGAFVLPGWARPEAERLHRVVADLWAQAPKRRMTTPYGQMSVEMTSCGDYGWISDAAGYRYSPVDPCTGLCWPPMPDIFDNLARKAAALAEFKNFAPNSCLVNAYAPGASMGLHQDRDEGDLAHPIVSVSLGLSAIFLWGGARRRDPVRKIALHHGDVVVWGGDSRLFYHGIQRINQGNDPLFGSCRVNLTFRHVVQTR